LQVDDLFTKIGILTVENDMLRAELNRANERIQELEQLAQPETVDVKVPPKEK
jgi:regulator of replication initiation timing